MGDYLIFNVASIVLFTVALALLILDIALKKVFLKIIFGGVVTVFVIVSILLGASFQEILIAILLLAVIALFSYYPIRREEKV